MLEREVESAVVRYAEDKGLLHMKLSGPHNRGKPDQMFLLKGQVCFIEMKKPNEKPTKLQAKWLADLTAEGFLAEYVDTIGKGKTLIDRFISSTQEDASLYDDL
jgi:hypothetical protein